MKKMRFFRIFIFFVFLLFKINLAVALFFTKPILNDYVTVARSIRTQKAALLAKRHNMVVVGEGGGMMHCVNYISLDFQIQGPYSLESLRAILVDCVDELLQGISSEPKLKGHLKMEPFTAQGLDIAIFQVDCNGMPLYDPHITVAGASFGTVNYLTVDRSRPNGYKSEYIENYEEAKRLVGR